MNDQEKSIISVDGHDVHRVGDGKTRILSDEEAQQQRAYAAQDDVFARFGQAMQDAAEAFMIFGEKAKNASA